MVLVIVIGSKSIDALLPGQPASISGDTRDSSENDTEGDRVG